MAEIIRMPRLSDTMEVGNIVGWLKKVGDKVKPGDVLAEVETDKATMELDNYIEGTLLYISKDSGEVPVNGIIAIIGKEGEDFKSLLDGASNDQPKVEQKVELVASHSENGVAPQPSSASNDSSRLKASPLAKSIAQGAGISLTTLVGTGEDGRIVKRDVEAALQNNTPSPSSTNLVSPPIQNLGEPFYEVAVNQMRKTIARRLGESKFSAPEFYLTIEINMDQAIEARKKINDFVAPSKVSFNDLVIKAVALSLKKHPAINSSWLGDKIRYNNLVNIGVAVAVEDGLMVPVIKNADLKSLTSINSEVATLAGKAKEKKILPEEMAGNTFTISNLGMFDIDEFTAIINPPDACILAVGSIKKTVGVFGDEIKATNIMKLTLTCDHRVVDGATGAKFLQTLKSLLESPVTMIV
jgi:pyruvate dehydrogenase E2 component (dihydrolipoamide acetyltransferase)